MNTIDSSVHQVQTLFATSLNQARFRRTHVDQAVAVRRVKALRLTWMSTALIATQ